MEATTAASRPPAARQRDNWRRHYINLSDANNSQQDFSLPSYAWLPSFVDV